MRGKIYDINDMRDPLWDCRIPDGYDLTEKFFDIDQFFINPARAIIPEEDVLNIAKSKNLELRIWQRAKKEPDLIVTGSIAKRFIEKMDGGYYQIGFKIDDGIERAIKRISYL